MPLVGSAVVGISSAIASAGGAVLGGLGGLAAAGTSALGGLAAAGAGIVSGITGIVQPAYGVTGGLIGPATKPLGYGLSELASKVIPIAKAGSQLYGMFKTPDDPAAVAQPVRTITTPGVAPANILNTLPNLIRPPAPAQIITTPPMLAQASENMLIKYAPWIAAAAIAYFVLRK